jgi:hypothetical protein
MDAEHTVTSRAIGPVRQIKNEEPNTNALLVLLGPRVEEKTVTSRRSDADAPELSGAVGAKKPSLMSSLLKTYSGSLQQAQQVQGQQGQEAQPPAKRPALNPVRRSV